MSKLFDFPPDVRIKKLFKCVEMLDFIANDGYFTSVHYQHSTEDSLRKLARQLFKSINWQASKHKEHKELLFNIIFLHKYETEIRN